MQNLPTTLGLTTSQVLDEALAIADMAGLEPRNLAIVYAPASDAFQVLAAVDAARVGSAWASLPQYVWPHRWAILICSIDAARSAFGARTGRETGPQFLIIERGGVGFREVAAPHAGNSN